MDVYTIQVEEKLKTAVQELQALRPELYLWVCHGGIDSPEFPNLTKKLSENARSEALPLIFRGGS